MTNCSDNKIFFIHIPKTAGTSLRRVVRQQYPEEHFAPVYSHAPEDLQALRDRINGLRILYGHFSYGFHKLMGVSAQYVAVVREPVERVLSFYFHQYNNPGAGYHDLAISGITLAELLEKNAIHELNNHMTRIISGHEGTGVLDDDAVLNRARKHAERDFLLIGLTERLPGAVSRLAELLGWPRDLELPTLNVGIKGTARVDAETLDLIRQYNRLDMALYEWVAGRQRRDN